MAKVITDQDDSSDGLDEVITDLIEEMEDAYRLSEDAAYAALIGFLTIVPISEIIERQPS